MARRKIAMLLGMSCLMITLAGCQGNTNNVEDKVSQEETKVTTQTNQSVSDFDLEFTGNDLDVGYDENNCTKISLNDTSIQVNGTGAVAEESVVTITSVGTFLISGSLSDGQIVVNAGELDKVKLVFDEVNIHCEHHAPVYIKQADKVFVTLLDGTENTITDGSSYELAEEDSNVDGAIFSKADVTFNGNGTLKVTSSYKHAIVSKDDLVITGGTYNITSNGQGLTGKDRVKIKNGTFLLHTKEDAIKSNQTEDSSKGYIYVENGTFTIESEEDGFSAETGLILVDGTYDITTGGGSENAQMKVDAPMGGGRFQGDKTDMIDKTPPSLAEGETMPEMPDRDGEKGTPPSLAEGETMPEIPDRDGERETPPNVDGSVPNNEQMNEGESVDITTTETISQKGLKSGTLQVIKGGVYTIDTVDDAIHCNGNVKIEGGEFSIQTGDDGLHADGNVVIEDGTITISKSYEGIEGYTIVVSGGNLHVVSNDDGFNATDGTSSDDIRGMQDPNNEESNENLYIKVTGGEIYVNATGDGMDSNGNFIVEGGTIIIDGPENGGNGAIDYSGTGTITGGMVIATGYSQMAQGFSDKSSQYSFLWNLDSNINSGEQVTIKNSSGEILYQWVATKSFNSIVFSSKDLVDKEVYTIETSTTSTQITLDGIVTSNGRMGMGGERPHGNKENNKSKESNESKESNGE